MAISLTGVALLACGDDDGSASTADDPTTTGFTTGPTTGTPPTTEVPTTGGETTGGEATTDDTGSSTGGEEPVACHALELPPELIEAGTWDAGLTIAGFAGYDGLTPSVHDFARHADGGVLAVGYFRYIGSDTVRPLARLDGGVWQQDPSLAFDPDRPTISAVAADPAGPVALATYSALPFELQQRPGEILLDDGGGFAVIGSFTGAVRTMAWYDDELWVAGVFSLDGQPAAPHLAIYGDMGWHEPPGGALIGLGAFELTVDDGEILVGGSFSGVGGINAQSVAAWDGAAWTGFDLPDATVYALARDEQGDLYGGGLFSVEGSLETGGIARWSQGSWQSLAGGLANSSFRGVVSDLAVQGGEVYVAGCFSAAGGVPADPASIATQGLARWTGTAWETLTGPDGGVGSAWFAPLKCGDEGPAAIWEAQHQRLFVDGDRIYLGGLFPGVDHTASQSVIAYEDGAWVAQGEPGRGFSGAARSLAVGGPECAVHVMGGVSHAGALEVNRRVLRDDGDAWTPIGPPTPADAYCWQLAVDAEGTPALACDLPPNGDLPPAGTVLRLAGDAWQSVGGEFVQGGAATVGFDPSGALWVGGGAGEGYVARLEGEDFVVLGQFNGRVGALAFRPTAADAPAQAVVGGYFTEFEGMAGGGIARWNGDSWQPLGEGIAGSVLAVAYAEDGTIYASTADDGTPDRMILARWDGAAWEDVATPEPGPVPAGYAFYSLLARGNYVVASGFAWPNSGQRNVFVYDGQTFESLRGGVTAIHVESSVLARSGLWFGGTIAEAGPPEARISSVGVAHLERL